MCCCIEILCLERRQAKLGTQLAIIHIKFINMIILVWMLVFAGYILSAFLRDDGSLESISGKCQVEEVSKINIIMYF